MAMNLFNAEGEANWSGNSAKTLLLDIQQQHLNW